MDEDEASSLVGMAKLNDYFCLYNNFDKHVSKMKKLAGADKIFVELYAREHQLALSSKNDTTAESEPHKEAYEVSQADIDREEALADFEGKIEEELARQANSLGPKSKVAPHRRLMIREDWLCLSKYFPRICFRFC